MNSANIAQYAELVNRYMDDGYTDGLPIIPPYPEAVEAMIAASGRSRNEILGTIPPKYAPLSIETLAINAVMAGCRPEYMPVIIAAVEAMLEPDFNWVAPAVTTKGVAPLILVNGPIRHNINLNCKGNLFGPGFRANATIGRAIRLVMINVGGAKSQELDKATFGHPGKYTYVIGEDEENSPWVPFHVEHGYDAADSTVAVIACEGPRQIHNLNPHCGPEGILLTLADAYVSLGTYNPTGQDVGLFIIGPEHRQTLSEAGWTKEQIREFLFEHCRRRAEEIRKTVGNGEVIWVNDDDEDDRKVPIFKRKEQIKVISAGGGAGRFSVVINSFSGRHCKWQMRKIKEPQKVQSNEAIGG